MASKAKPGYLQLKEACAEVVRVLRAGEPVSVREYELCKMAGEAAEQDDKAALDGAAATKKLGKLIGELEQLPMGCAGFYHATTPPYHRDPLPLVINGLKLTLQQLLEKGATKQ